MPLGEHMGAGCRVSMHSCLWSCTLAQQRPRATQMTEPQATQTAKAPSAQKSSLVQENILVTF